MKLLPEVHEKLDKITTDISKFDWDTLKDLNKNILTIFVTLEDLVKRVEECSTEISVLNGKMNEFLTEFTVSEQIPVDSKSPKALGVKDGSTIYSMIKTTEEEDPFVPLSKVDPKDLEKAVKRLTT